MVGCRTCPAVGVSEFGKRDIFSVSLANAFIFHFVFNRREGEKLWQEYCKDGDGFRRPFRSHFARKLCALSREFWDRELEGVAISSRYLDEYNSV